MLTKASGRFAYVAQNGTEATVSRGLSLDPGSGVKISANVDITRCTGYEVRLNLDLDCIIAYSVQKVVFRRHIAIKPYGKDAFISKDGD